MTSTRLLTSQLSCQQQNVKSFTTNSLPLLFKVTDGLFAEPLKKKKRLDPAIVKAREERKKRKIEKEIRRLQRHAKQFKPIEEVDVPFVLIDEEEQRTRNPELATYEEQESWALLEKEWARYKQKQNLNIIQMMDRLLISQQKALDELRLESEELYQAAIQMNAALLPFKATGPVDTPPIKDYGSPDGEYQDVSKVW